LKRLPRTPRKALPTQVNALMVFFLHVLHGAYIILAIPLALSGSATAEALLMSAILLIRLRQKVNQDQGMVRLQRRRTYESRQKQVLSDMLMQKEIVM